MNPLPPTPRARFYQLLGLSTKVNVLGGIYGIDVGHGWTRYVHVNGGIYFYHSQRRILTDNNMVKARWRTVVETAWDEWTQAYEEDGLMAFVPPDADIILRYGYGACRDDELPEPGDLPEMFFVSHKDGTEIRQSSGPGALWWMSSLCSPNLCLYADLIIEASTYRYWTHVEEYPMHLKPNHVLPRARACFLHAMTFLYNGEHARRT